MCKLKKSPSTNTTKVVKTSAKNPTDYITIPNRIVDNEKLNNVYISPPAPPPPPSGNKSATVLWFTVYVALLLCTLIEVSSGPVYRKTNILERYINSDYLVIIEKDTLG